VRPLSIALLLITFIAATASAAVEVGKEPPDYLGKDPSGRQIHVSDYRGKLVIVSFFASWCGPCRKELPMLAEIQKQAGRDKIVVVAVNYKEGSAVVRKLRKSLDEYGVTITDDYSGSIGSKFGVAALPRLVLIGRDGRVAAAHVGYGEASLPGLVKEINRIYVETATP